MSIIDQVTNDEYVERVLSNNDSVSSASSNDIRFVDDTTVTLIKPFEEQLENEFDSDDPLIAYRTPTCETVIVSEVPNIILDDENAILAPGEGQIPNSLTQDEFCEELAHPHLFPTGKFGYNVERDIKLSPTKYFNQRLLNYTQKFASDSDYIFFAHKTLLQLNLRSKINIAMRISNSNLTAGLLANNFNDTIQNCVASDNAYKFMSTIKGTPAYWQHMLSDVLAMVKQLGVPTYFMTLSCADLRWEEFVTIIRQLSGDADTDHELLDYQSRCALLNSNPIVLVRQYQYRKELFFKEIIMDGQLGKITYYALRVEFTFRGSPHDHCLLWAKDVPKLEDGKEKYIEHIDSVISANVPDREESPELWNLVTKYQIHSHSRTCSKYRKNECRFQFGKLFCKRTILSEPLPEGLPETEKHDILVARNNVIQTVQEYIDTNLHPKKRNILDPDKPEYIEIGSIDTILDSLGLNYETYEYYLSISPDKDQHLFLKRDPYSCFVNNYFAEGLLAWEANIDIQPVFNAYKAVTYMCAYFSKSEDKCSTAMQEALKQAKDSNDSQFEKMSKIAKVYNSNRECSIQEAVYLTMPELWLRKCFPAISFVNTNLPDQRSEENDLKLDGSYVLKLNLDEVNAVVNENKQIFEPDGHLVDLVLQNYRNDLMHNQDAFAQQENDEVQDLMSNSSDSENDDESHEVEQNFAPFTQTVHGLQTDDQINTHIRSLNSKQRDIFDIVLNWGKMYVQNSKSNNPVLLEPLRIFLTGGAGVGKSHLIKCIYNCLSKVLAYKSDELEKPRIIKLAPTGIAAINISGTTVHTGLSIPVGKFRNMADKQRTAIRNKLHHVKLIIIDEISMISSQQLLNIHTRLCEIFGVNDNTPFAGKSIIVCGDLFQLPPIFQSSVFSTEGPIIGAFKLWHLFKLAELDEIMRQKDDSDFIDLLNNVRVGELNNNDESMIKSRLISREQPDYPIESLHLFAENASVHLHNIQRLDTLPSETIHVEAMDVYPRDFTESQITKVKNLPLNDTGGLSVLFDLKIGARVMLISNIDIEDRLINGQLGTVTDVKFRNIKAELIYVKLDDKTAGIKAQSKDQYAKATETVPIEKSEVNFPFDKKNPYTSPIISRTQFPLKLAYACTVHKVQGLTLDSVVVSFDLARQRKFNAGQMYVAMSRVKNLNGLYFTGQYRRSAFVCSDKVSEEYTRLRQSKVERVADIMRCSSNLNVCPLNVRSLKRHAVDIQKDRFLYENDLLCLTETQMSYEHSEEDKQSIHEKLPYYILSHNIDQHKFNSVTVCHSPYFIDIDEYDHSSCFSLVKFRKAEFTEKEFCVLVLYKSSRIQRDLFCYNLAQFIERYTIDIILGDFNMDGFEMEHDQLLADILQDYDLVPNFPTHIDGKMLDQIWTHKELVHEYGIEVIRKCVNLSDHDGIKLSLTLLA
ncbi:uncharacterized protein [Clytia hemisphaerica]|uniref:uncharacterized protein n=1 Tax=Clytia hemisphaerica TaxID=252671 RepID=UPI0034D67E48